MYHIEANRDVDPKVVFDLVRKTFCDYALLTFGGALHRLKDVVEIGPIPGLPDRITERVREGFVLGDFQFCPDTQSPDLLKEGVFSCYRPMPKETLVPGNQAALNPTAWRQLISCNSLRINFN